MAKPTLSAGSRLARRSWLSATVVAASLVAVAAGGCGESRTGPDGTVQSGVPGNPSATDSTAPGTPTIATNPGGTTTGPGANTGGPASPGGPSASVDNPGGVPTSESPGSGGSSPNGPAVPTGPGSGGNEATLPEPCVDVEPPPTEEWPDATCARWAAETEECSETWFASYCDVSCGRCVPASGMSPNPGTPAPPPCVDVEPPPSEEWPDATCARWAAETEECSETWFANYCDVSCGRCVPEAGMTPTPVAPEPKPCEDIAPPPSAEWPDATCENWALETDECGKAWFANYCDISCGRCVPEGGLPPMPMAPDCSGEGLPNVTGGDGFATRYWDCCQTHCAQQSGRRCGQDGSSGTGDQNSSCNGGGSFACYDEAPRAVSECLSYGHIAKSNPNCGACYRIQFTGQGEHNPNDPGSRLIKGKQMIVKVSNTGGDVAGNQFDLMIPGGGVGRFNACSRQWGTNDLGEQYGGFLSSCTGGHAAKKECVREQCAKIPAGSARDGCLWFVDWFQVADNPKYTSQQVDCPF